jgi:hypothetical protein
VATAVASTMSCLGMPVLKPLLAPDRICSKTQHGYFQHCLCSMLLGRPQTTNHCGLTQCIVLRCCLMLWMCQLLRLPGG